MTFVARPGKRPKKKGTCLPSAQTGPPAFSCNNALSQRAPVNLTGRVARAADKGGAVELVHSLPDGFDTMLGRTFDKGVDLSGGEWQKIALSSAFMREAQILINDEPCIIYRP